MVAGQNCHKVKKYFLLILFFLLFPFKGFSENFNFIKIIDLDEPWSFSFISKEEFKLGNDIPKGFFGSFIPFSVGSLSSMLGIGGGTFNVSLMTLFGKTIHKAVGTASGLGFYLAIPGTIFFIITLSVCQSIDSYFSGPPGRS